MADFNIRYITNFHRYYDCLQEELQAYKTIQEMFSEEMNEFLVIVFNGLDVYDNKKTTSKS